MSLQNLGGVAVLVLMLSWPAQAADDMYSAKTVPNAPAPKELQEPIRKLLDERCVQFLDAKGELLAEIWFRKDVPAKASDAQIKNGLTYREIPETTLLGAIRIAKQSSDYRKQKVPAGVYTLRLAYQPMDGDHMGTAPFSEFCLLSPAAEDKNPNTMEPKSLHEMSARTTNSHPGVLLLFPGKGKTTEPKFTDMGGGHGVLLYQLELKIGDKKAIFPIGLTLIGASTAA
jgi:hypothetical protein